MRARRREGREAADILTPYATMYRYPDEPLEPDRDQFEEALQMASSVYGFVVRMLPEATQP